MKTLLKLWYELPVLRFKGFSEKNPPSIYILRHRVLLPKIRANVYQAWITADFLSGVKIPLPKLKYRRNEPHFTGITQYYLKTVYRQGRAK